MRKTLTGTLVPVMTDETSYTAGSPTDDPEPLEQVHDNLEDADASASRVHASASRRLHEARELLSRVESARGYFSVVGAGPFDGLAQPSKGKKGKRKRKSSSQRGAKSTNLGRMSQQGEERLHFHQANGHLIPTLWVVQCSMPRVMVQLSKKPNKIKTTMTSKTLPHFPSRVWRGSPFLMEEPRRPFLDS